jgi:hypothetical protein
MIVCSLDSKRTLNNAGSSFVRENSCLDTDAREDIKVTPTRPTYSSSSTALIAKSVPCSRLISLGEEVPTSNDLTIALTELPRRRYSASLQLREDGEFSGSGGVVARTLRGSNGGKDQPLQDTPAITPNTATDAVQARTSSVDQIEPEVTLDGSVTTVRFQHFSTDDGHHAIKNARGQLELCEDEVSKLPNSNRTQTSSL